MHWFEIFVNLLPIYKCSFPFHVHQLKCQKLINYCASLDFTIKQTRDCFHWSKTQHLFQPHLICYYGKIKIEILTVSISSIRTSIYLIVLSRDSRASNDKQLLANWRRNMPCQLSPLKRTVWGSSQEIKFESVLSTFHVFIPDLPSPQEFFLFLQLPCSHNQQSFHNPPGLSFGSLWN